MLGPVKAVYRALVPERRRRAIGLARERASILWN